MYVPSVASKQITCSNIYIYIYIHVHTWMGDAGEEETYLIWSRVASSRRILVSWSISVEVGASWTAAVAAMAAAAAAVEDTEEGKCDREFLPSKGKRAMARNKEAQHQRQHKRMLQNNNTAPKRRERRRKRKRNEGDGQGWVQGWPQSGVRDGQRFFFLNFFWGVGPIKWVFLNVDPYTPIHTCSHICM